ncbi:MAG: hypothetical protein H0T85_03975 [Geodermatophilaceae bacterium]|nr:hypothetical protein [Geodermatophilaceae bacterium]
MTRYVALALAGTDRVEAAAELLHEVHADPRSGPLWQLRAHHDLRALGHLDVPRSPGASAAASSGAWAWLDDPVRPGAPA